MKRGIILSLLLLFVVWSAIYFSRYAGEEVKSSSPSLNVIFVILDAARADHFSGYGYGRNTTPAIDAISRKGALFLNHFVQATATYESIPSIFFSRYFSRAVFPWDTLKWGARYENPEDIFRTFDAQQIFLPELLSGSGYLTAIFHGHPWFEEETYLVRKFDEAFYSPVSPDGSGEAKLLDDVISWLEENRGRRFFIYLHIMSPHAPYRWSTKGDDLLAGEDPAKLEAVREKYLSRETASAEGWSPEELTYLNLLYDLNLSNVDSQVGRLYIKLNELGLLDDTLLIVTSDHGENLGEHGDLDHGGTEWGALPWDSLLHVPLIMVYPPIIPSGVRVSGRTESIDIMPTILDLCGIELPPDKSMDGSSLRRNFGEPEKGKEAIYTRGSIRTAQYKYLPGEGLLFDLEEDPGEEFDISENNPSLAGELKTRHRDFLGPFERRFRETERKRPLSYPFFFPIYEFELSPPEALQECEVKREPRIVLEKIISAKPWLHNVHSYAGGLFCLPEVGVPEPITCSILLPDGAYRVLLWVEVFTDDPFSPERSGMRTRFKPQDPFREPVEVSRIEEDRERYSYYFDCGEVLVENKEFFLEIDCRPPKGEIYFIHHVKFIPVGSEETERKEVGEGEELKRKKAILKSLGYL